MACDGIVARELDWDGSPASVHLLSPPLNVVKGTRASKITWERGVVDVSAMFAILTISYSARNHIFGPNGCCRVLLNLDCAPRVRRQPGHVRESNRLRRFPRVTRCESVSDIAF